MLLGPIGYTIRVSRFWNDRHRTGILHPWGDRGLNKAKSPPTRNSAAQLQRLARERADEQARRIPWQRLYDVRNQYIDQQEFYLWVRSIVEIEERIPDWLAPILDQRCPGFLAGEKEMSADAKVRPLALRLEDWIDEHIFGFAKNEGWLDAIAYYAIRDPRYQRAEVCWAECVEKWKRAKPIRYPSFEEWQAFAAGCDDTARLNGNEREARASSKLVDRDRLREAVARYIDWEAVAYWARPALEHCAHLPDEVASELHRRCPGFLEAGNKGPQPVREDVVQPWQRLTTWIADHFFADARAEGWFDAILVEVRNHPRAVRTMEYADHCDELWNSEMPVPYPSFEEWRRNADSYVDLRNN